MLKQLKKILIFFIIFSSLFFISVSAEPKENEEAQTEEIEIVELTHEVEYKDVKYFKIRKDPILNRYGINIIDVYITSGIKNRRHSLGYVEYNNAINILSRIFV